MINYLMISGIYARNFLHGWARRILYSEGEERIVIYFSCAILWKGLETDIGNLLRAQGLLVVLTKGLVGWSVVPHTRLQ
jgi:hypothetical protein